MCRVNRFARPDLAFGLLQPFIQFIGELLTVALIECRRSAGLHAAGAHGIHEIAHVQTLFNGFSGVAFAARIKRDAAFLDHFRCQRDIGGDH